MSPPVSNICKERHLKFAFLNLFNLFFSSWDVTVMLYSLLLCCYEFGCCGICTRGNAADTELTAQDVGNVQVGTVGINNRRIVVQNQISAPNGRPSLPR